MDLHQLNQPMNEEVLRELLRDFPTAAEATRLADAALASGKQTTFSEGGSVSRAEFEARANKGEGMSPLAARLGKGEKR